MQPQARHLPVEVRSVMVPAGSVRLEGELTLPRLARGVVLFAHGSGSSRHSPRNRSVASFLASSASVATLLLDLLSSQEESVDRWTREHRFDIDLLAGRLEHAMQWLVTDPATRELAIGLFGASTGAAGALLAAARRPDRVSAVVSRGGRPDLVGEALTVVQAPTLLIVGGKDHLVLELNRSARQLLPGTSALEIVAGATHLFEEPGALDQVARLTGGWFHRYLR